MKSSLPSRALNELQRFVAIHMSTSFSPRGKTTTTTPGGTSEFVQSVPVNVAGSLMRFAAHRVLWVALPGP